MSKILKAIAAATLLVVAGLASAGAGAADADRLRGAVEPVVAKKPYRIGVTVVHFVDDYWKGIAYGLTEESKEANVQIVRLLGAGGYGKVLEDKDGPISYFAAARKVLGEAMAAAARMRPMPH